ncbi:hypothetical protein ABE042_21930 [Viridibacillus arvi]|uniref:hypothetical protein n=1 Tax=Viridibacillus arvi TaxID=263475 RepID=UPI003D2AE458
MPKIEGVRMGVNLGFIEKIVLVDGTILENMQVLFNSPIPNLKQFEKMLKASAEISNELIGPATYEWSSRPELEPRSIGLLDSYAKAITN